MTDIETPWLTSRQAAAYLQIHRNTLDRVPPEELPFTRVGPTGHRRYNRVDLDAYLARGVVTMRRSAAKA